MKQPLERPSVLTSHKYSSTVFNSWESLASLVTMDETTDQNSKPECSTQRAKIYCSVLPQRDILCGKLAFTALQRSPESRSYIILHPVASAVNQ